MSLLDRYDSEPDPLGNAEAITAFRQLIRALEERVEPDDSPRGQLLYAMGVVEHALVAHEGEEWNQEDFADFLSTLRETLGQEARFNAETQSLIRFSLDEIAACGRELDEVGESSRAATEAVGYLVARVVDWCRWHPEV